MKNYLKEITFVLMALFVLTACTDVAPVDPADTGVADDTAPVVGEAEDNRALIEQLVRDQAKAWKTGDTELLASTMHDDIVFAYPGRRLNKQETIEDLEYFAENFENPEVYINNIIIDGTHFAVEWQFASTKKETGTRSVVSDGIIGEIKDGKILVWKEYLDGRIKTLQAEGELELEEGEEPFPWPLRVTATE